MVVGPGICTVVLVEGGVVLVGTGIVDDGTNVTPVVLEDPSPGELVVGKKLVGGNGVDCAEA